jgi:hypothetical protein
MQTAFAPEDFREEEQPESPTAELYSDLIGEIEPGRRTIAESGSLDEEIRMLRMLMVTVLRLAEGADDLELAMKVLNSVGTASQRVMNLRRTQTALGGSRGGKFDQALNQVLREVAEKMKIRQQNAGKTQPAEPLPGG